MNSADGWGDDVYQPDGSEVQDDAGLLDAEDTLVADGVEDPLDRGWSPPDRPWAVERDDVTAAGREHGETLDQRLAEEVPDLGVSDGDGIGDSEDTDGELLDTEVGDTRSGRLVAPDEGAHEDQESGLVATDVGIDGAAASAEEAAMHIVDEDEDSSTADLAGPSPSTAPTSQEEQSCSRTSSPTTTPWSSGTAPPDTPS